MCSCYRQQQSWGDIIQAGSRLQVYMSAAKRKVMACLDLRPEYASLLTTDDRATNIQAVPLWMCSQKVGLKPCVCHPYSVAMNRHNAGRLCESVLCIPRTDPELPV